MNDVLIKTVPFADGLELRLFESPNEGGGAYISIKHSVNVRDMPGEVIVAPAVVSELIRALVEAARELECRAMYRAGLEDGRT